MKRKKGLVKRIFKMNLFIMRLLGFYPPLGFENIYKIYSVTVYVFFTVPVPVLAAFHLIVTENVDLNQVSENSFIIVQCGCFIWKLIPFIFNVNEIRKSVYMIELPIFNNYTQEQDKLIEKCKEVCKTNTWLFLGFCATSFSAWVLEPLLGSVRNFPIEVWLPFDPLSGKKTHFFTYIFIISGIGNGAISNGVIDPLISGMACFASYQLKILKNNLQYLSEDAEKELNFDSTTCLQINKKHDLKNKLIYNKIKQCIEHHNAILSFIEYYTQIYSMVAFTQFTASVVVVCVSCLQLSMVEPFTFSFFAMVTFLMTMLLEIFLYSYFGTSLFEESNSLTTAIYMGKWYDYDIKCKKALLILMERSKKPVIVTAGKILDLSLVTFATILRRAYSLLAVLKNYQLDM